MTVVCPYCRHRMRVKGAHAGKFRPLCDRCEGMFLLVISPDSEAEPMVMPIAGEEKKQLEGSHAGA